MRDIGGRIEGEEAALDALECCDCGEELRAGGDPEHGVKGEGRRVGGGARVAEGCSVVEGAFFNLFGGELGPWKNILRTYLIYWWRLRPPQVWSCFLRQREICLQGTLWQNESMMRVEFVAIDNGLYSKLSRIINLYPGISILNP